MYFNCEICGNLSDEGAFIEINGRKAHICFDCADSLETEQITIFPYGVCTEGADSAPSFMREFVLSPE